MHAPLMAIPVGTGDQSLWHHGEATDRTVAQEKKGHGSGPAEEAHDAIGGGACPGREARDQKIEWIESGDNDPSAPHLHGMPDQAGAGSIVILNLSFANP
jgi:hypothetical protein